MKKMIMFLVLLIGIPLSIFAQDIPAPPSDWSDIIFNLPQWFGTVTGVSLLTTFVAAFLNGILEVNKGIYKQLIAWLVAIVLMVVTDLLNFGFAADFPYLLAVIYGFMVGLVANGVFDVPFIKSILDKVEEMFKPKPSP